jgi:hypothetical protein
MTRAQREDPARTQRLIVLAITLVLFCAGVGFAFASGAGPREADPALIVRSKRPIESVAATGPAVGETSAATTEDAQPTPEPATDAAAGQTKAGASGGAAGQAPNNASSSGNKQHEGAEDAGDEAREIVTPELRDEEEGEPAAEGSDEKTQATPDESDAQAPEHDGDGERTQQETESASD